MARGTLPLTRCAWKFGMAIYLSLIHICGARADLGGVRMMRELKKEAFALAREAVAASMPDEAVRRALAELAPAKGKTVAVAVGKAAWPMAQAAARALAGHLDAGYVITKYGHAQGELPGFQVFEAGHPQMDENGVRATRAVLEAVAALAAEVLSLIHI